jgi:hypothetical protein
MSPSPDFAEAIYREQMPMYTSQGTFDRKALALIRQSFLEMQVLSEMPDDKVLFTEEFLP